MYRLTIIAFAGFLVLTAGGPVFNSSPLVPHQVSLENFRGLHVCSGSLVKPDVVITAAHCIEGVTSLSVRVGTNVPGFGGQVVQMKKNCPVKGYDFHKKDNDVAVLRLKTPVTLNDKVRPVELPQKNVDVPDGTVGSVSGWGYSLHRDIKKIRVEKVSSEVCKRVYGDDAVTSNMICMKYKEPVDTCSDDVKGNPLMVDDRIVGVVSVPGTCNVDGGNPGVYARINPVTIQSDIDACV